MNSLGTIQWQKSIGGSSREDVYTIIQTSDGGYILAAESDSDDGDISESPNGGMWVVKLNSQGNIEWQKSFSEADFYHEGSPIQQTTDGGYILSGVSLSTNNDIDFWYLLFQDFEKVFVFLVTDENFNLVFIKLAGVRVDVEAVDVRPRAEVTLPHLQ